MIVGAVIYDSGSGSGSLLTFSNILDRRDFNWGPTLGLGEGGGGLARANSHADTIKRALNQVLR